MILNNKCQSHERGQVYRPGKVSLAVALVYPNTYAVGMASLGFQTVYRLFNEIEDVGCERVFFDPGYPDVRSVETGRRLTQFDLIAFSLSFELDYLNVARILHCSGIPLRSSERGPSFPLVMAGGVSITLNPEPLADLCDLLGIGEAEEILESVAGQIMSYPKDRSSRQAMLKHLAQVPGVYVPKFYTYEYGTDGTISAIDSLTGVPRRVRRMYLQDIDSVPSYSPIISGKSHFKDMFLIEVGRGCPRGCRFCAAGFIYTPVRFRTATGLLSRIDSRDSDHQRIGLVGSAVSDHPHVQRICRALADDGHTLGISSLRADALSPSLIESLVRSGMKTLTLAPETGSEELRRRIHKNLTDDEILEAVRIASAGGIQNLKLYFLVGLPFPGTDDVLEMIGLVKRIRESFLVGQRKRGRVTVSIHPFIPKAWTPFQWCPMADVTKLTDSMKTISAQLRQIPGVRVTPKSPRRAILQGILSVGDRRIGEAICLQTEDQLHWKSVWKQLHIDPAFYVYRNKGNDELLPWEVLDAGIDRTYLWNEYQKAMV